MADTNLRVALALPDNHVAEVLAVPEAILVRMARHAQCRAMRPGLDGPIAARLSLLPRRGIPSLAGSLRWEFSANGHRSVETLPTSTLQPLIAAPAATLRQAAELPADASISYVVLMPAEPGPVWQEQLSPFRALSVAASNAASRPLFPDRAFPGDTPIQVRPAVLEEAMAYCLDHDIEKGGVLLGFLRHAGDGTLAAEIIAFAPAVGAVADATHLTFTVEAWQNIMIQRVAVERALGLPQPLQILGWIHGHPRIEGLGGPFFLSSHDTAIMAQHFPEPLTVAIIVDAWAEADTPLEQALAVFGWDEHGVGLVTRSIDLLEETDHRR
jgi:hypothetical protein